MATQKFITIDSTGKKILRGAVDSSLGSADSGKIVGLNVDGKVDISMIPTAVGKVGCNFTLSEAITAGDWVNVFTDGTDYKVRLADITDSAKVCHGYATATGIAGDSVLIMFEGLNSYLSTTGLVNGSSYFLDKLGKAIATPDMTIPTSKFVQPLGYCVNIDATTLAIRFEQDEVIYLE
jgi:hypothetical protein